LWVKARFTACLHREYTLPQYNADTTNRRLDLLVVDSDNKLILVIENKAGARFRTAQ